VTASTIVSIRDVTFYRGPRKIFDSLSLDIPRGKITFVMGPSGTGKTTLLNLIAGQLKQDSGSICVDNQEICVLSRKELYALRKRMSMQFQRDALFTNISVFDNIAFPLREHTDFSEPMIRDIVLLKLEAVGLRGAHTLMPHELSGGMSRRVSLARAVALDPEIMLYDEPFTGQDPISKAVLVKLVRSLNDALGITSIIVSHNVEIAMKIADLVCVLSEGRVIASGSPQEIEVSSLPPVVQFFKGLPDGPVPFHYPSDDLFLDLAKEGSNA
jgi:phospholipid/cholesterol/gamma-HCH transport system ATP-binding protein